MSLTIQMLGHAGLVFESGGMSLACDPWFTPAYGGCWYPFPANAHLRSRLDDVDAVYISHAHRDHLDPAVITDLADRGAAILIPRFDDPELRLVLDELGVKPAAEIDPEEDLDFGPFHLSTATTEHYGVSDSCLVLEADGVLALDQNDCHPRDLGFLPRPPDLQFLQFSGAHWHPGSYVMPAAEKAQAMLQKRGNVMRRARLYAEASGARAIVPFAGPACFLDPDLEHHNDLPGAPPTDLPDLAEFRTYMREHGHEIVWWVPGTTLEASPTGVVAHHPDRPAGDPDPYHDKRAYLAHYRQESASVEHQHAPASSCPSLRLPGHAGRVADHRTYALRYGERPPIEALYERIAGVIAAWHPDDLPPATCRFALTSGEGAIVIDFPTLDHALVEAAAVPAVDWLIDVPPDLLAGFLVGPSSDLASSVFLSHRCSMRRECAFSEAPFAVLRMLDVRRVRAVRRGGRGDDALQAGDGPAEEGERIEINGAVVPRWCPHQGADLSRFGTVEDGVLTCSVHGWCFEIDPATGALTWQARSRRAALSED